MKIVCISDTHGLHEGVAVPEGDLLIHAGDLTDHGQVEQVVSFNQWLGELPHRHKVVIAGNHDFLFEREAERAESLITNAIYLRDSGMEIAGVSIYGSPWQPWFYDWAFNLQRGDEIRAKWDAIPPETQILITHGPPVGHGGVTASGEDVGCVDLLNAIRRVQPQLHVFGLIHEGYGVTREGPTSCVNASICDLSYDPVNAPIVVEL
jgi:Icc-related predicted phosphoesterase